MLTAICGRVRKISLFTYRVGAGSPEGISANRDCMNSPERRWRSRVGRSRKRLKMCWLTMIMPSCWRDIDSRGTAIRWITGRRTSMRSMKGDLVTATSNLGIQPVSTTHGGLRKTESADADTGHWDSVAMHIPFSTWPTLQVWSKWNGVLKPCMKGRFASVEGNGQTGSRS